MRWRDLLLLLACAVRRTAEGLTSSLFIRREADGGGFASSLFIRREADGRGLAPFVRLCFGCVAVGYIAAFL